MGFGFGFGFGLGFGLKASTLFASSVISGYYTQKTYTSVLNKISKDQELILEYPYFVSSAHMKTKNNLIVRIPQNHISPLNPVGRISINGQLPIIKNIYLNNLSSSLTSFLGIVNLTLDNETHTIASCTLFPEKFNDLIKINNSVCKIKIGKTFYTLSQPENIIERYTNIIKTETANPYFNLSVNTEIFSKIFLKEEFVTDGNVYLLCDVNVGENKLVAKMITDDVKHIYDEKYYWDYVKCGALGALSIVSLLSICFIKRT